MIVPCGIRGKGITSLANELEREVAMDEVIERVESHFAALFDAELTRATEPPLAGLDPSAWAPDAWRDAAGS